jgi:hypothetical protein
MTDNMQEKDIKYYTEYFFVSTKTNIKLFKYKEGKIIFISDFEFKNYDIINEEIHIQNIRQLDNGIITIHLNNTHFSICLSPKFIVFFRNIILNLMEVFNYLESIIIKDKEKISWLRHLMKIGKIWNLKQIILYMEKNKS